MACCNDLEPDRIDDALTEIQTAVAAEDAALVQAVVTRLIADYTDVIGQAGEQLVCEQALKAGLEAIGYTPGRHGIDNILGDGSGHFVAFEVKTTATGHASLASTAVGEQLSDRWARDKLSRMSDPEGDQGRQINPEIAARIEEAGLDRLVRILSVADLQRQEIRHYVRRPDGRFDPIDLADLVHHDHTDRNREVA